MAMQKEVEPAGLNFEGIRKILGKEGELLLEHTCTHIPKEQLPQPGPDWVSRMFAGSDRNNRVLASLERLFSHGRLKNTGYLSILPVDQGVEHSAGASFAPNPIYFNPENVVKLAIEAGCNGVASTRGVLGKCARKYAHKIPFILKINHNQLLSYPNTYDQTLFASVQQAYDMGCVAVGATIYFGSEESNRQIQEISQAFCHAHELGMATILWCYLRNKQFKIEGKDYHESADLTGQANHLGFTLGADIVKQKLPTNNGGYEALDAKCGGFGKWSKKMYETLCPKSASLIDYCRYQVLNSYGIGLINSGGAAGNNDWQEAVQTAVINKRAGGIGLISGRKTFQRPMNEGVELFHAIQDVYLCKEIGLA
jgi:class I fructose-bisphosphate aldolase